MTAVLGAHEISQVQDSHRVTCVSLDAWPYTAGFLAATAREQTKGFLRVKKLPACFNSHVTQRSYSLAPRQSSARFLMIKNFVLTKNWSTPQRPLAQVYCRDSFGYGGADG